MAAATPMRQGTQTFDAQLFERARIEIHRDAGANTRVMLGRIGADVAGRERRLGLERAERSASSWHGGRQAGPQGSARVDAAPPSVR